MIQILSARHESGTDFVDVTEHAKELFKKGFFYVGDNFGDPFPLKHKSLRVKYEAEGKQYEDLVPERGLFVPRPFVTEGVESSRNDEFFIEEAVFGANKYVDFTETAKIVFKNPFEYFCVSNQGENSNPFIDPEPGISKYYVIRFVFKGRTFVSVTREFDAHIRLLSPIFSVIITTWNRAKFLPRCVGSVMEQDFLINTRLHGLPNHSRVETIVVDDGSTDDTAEVMANICKIHPSVIYLKIPHTGCCGMVRNVGIKMSSGKFLAYLDSDDKYYPFHLSKVYERFLKTRALRIRTQSQFCRLKVMPDGSIKESLEIDFGKKIYDRWNTYPSCCVYRRELLKYFVPKEYPEQNWPMAAKNAGDDELFYNVAEVIERSLGLEVERIEEPTVLYGLIVKGNNITYQNPQVAAEYRDKEL
jgi:hypothetical protein